MKNSLLVFALLTSFSVFAFNSSITSNEALIAGIEQKGEHKCDDKCKKDKDGKCKVANSENKEGESTAAKSCCKKGEKSCKGKKAKNGKKKGQDKDTEK